MKNYKFENKKIQKYIDKDSGYFFGPDSVFYDPREDRLLSLEWEGAHIYNFKLHRNVGKVYYISRIKSKRYRCIFNDANYYFYIGEL